VCALFNSNQAERRSCPRYSWATEIAFIALPPVEKEQQLLQSLRAVTENIGRGGISIVSQQSPCPESLLRFEIPVPGIPAAIPTLLKVRWSQHFQPEGLYRLGLQFVL
jgi:PilZ domain